MAISAIELTLDRVSPGGSAPMPSVAGPHSLVVGARLQEADASLLLLARRRSHELSDGVEYDAEFWPHCFFRSSRQRVRSLWDESISRSRAQARMISTLTAPPLRCRRFHAPP